jgi:hypothetical protein
MLTLVSMRGLEQSTGISKFEANNVLNAALLPDSPNWGATTAKRAR